MGYAKAGFDVVGVDIVPQPHYPFTFVQANAMEFPLEGFDLIHASPPCQAYAYKSTEATKARYPRLIAPIRERLIISNIPYVIENVIGARSQLKQPILLCGAMFDLRIPRHRLFECNWPIVPPVHPVCRGLLKRTAREMYVTFREASVTGNQRTSGGVHIGQELMEMPWVVDWDEIREAIPPRYTEYIGRAFTKVVVG